MEFLLLALIAGLGVALIAAPLGSFVVWQRLAYFGDTLAHSSLLGVAFSLLFSIGIQAAITTSCLIVAIVLLLWQSQRQLPTDTLLGIISHSSLALGLILVSLFDTGRVDLTQYLLGDILSTTRNDIFMVLSVAITVGILIWRFWKPLLAITVNESLAQVEGIPVKRTKLILMFMLAITIAVAIKIVGILLITALLIIPAAGARYLSRTPEQMVLFAAMLGCLAVCGGLASSFFWDTPAGPSIVAVSSLLFLFALSLRKRHI